MAGSPIETFHSIRFIDHKISAVFEVELKDRTCVYMYTARSDYMDDQRCVVVVDPGKLLALWRREPDSAYSKLSMGNAAAWTADKHYKAAAEAFAGGLDAPVPLPEISCGQSTYKVPVYKKKWIFFKKLVREDEKRIDYVSITDGVPAILWLLAHGAKEFPVECDRESVDRLTETAGGPGQSYRTVDQLTQDR